MLTPTSTILLEGLKDLSNATAWEEFDARYHALLMAVGRRLGLNDADAEDATQETVRAFLREYREGKYQRQNGLRDWLAGIMSHKVRDLQRRLARDRRLLQESPTVIDSGPAESVQAAMDEEWAKATLRQCIAEVRTQVPPQMFESFELTALQMMPAAQVAQRLGISVDAVYQNKSRVLQKVRQLLPEMEKQW